MHILGIETSCDETAAAIVNDGRKIISNIITSSSGLHEKTGGIIPEMAAREQIKYIIPTITEALAQAQMSFEEIDAIAVTIGPGLIGPLLVGVESAKTLAYVAGKPVIPVNHVVAHIYANWLLERDKDTSGVARRDSPDGGGIRFPAIALVVSGGHTELFHMNSEIKLRWLGGTRDDAAGEAFDKTARLLDLGYPGGPVIAAEAAKFRIQNSEFRIQLPRPMIGEDNLDFSFSGLKTAVMREVNKLKSLKKLNDNTISFLAYELQESITDVLVHKTLQAAKKFHSKSILLGGGVAANERLSEKFFLEIRNSKLEISLCIPPPALCTDNAAYIASYAYFHNKPVSWQKIQAQPDLRVEI